jgi:asparagine synthetase B (glutamine-hydrolysing)
LLILDKQELAPGAEIQQVNRTGRNISSLPPSHLMTIVEGQLESPSCYYSPESQVNPFLYEHLSEQSPQSVTAEIKSLIATSVQDRLVSDVPVGTLCSGGLIL